MCCNEICTFFPLVGVGARKYPWLVFTQRHTFRSRIETASRTPPPPPPQPNPTPHPGSLVPAPAEPFSDFFDFMALGDGEELLVEIGQCLRRCRADRLDREATLHRLATEVEGVYVPQFYQPPDGCGGAGGTCGIGVRDWRMWGVRVRVVVVVDVCVRFTPECVAWRGGEWGQR